MSWGDALAKAYGAATDAAKQTASSMMSSASNAADAVLDAAARARDATAAAARAAAQATANAARTAAQATASAARTAAQATASAARTTASAVGTAARMGGNVAGFGARAVGDAAGMAGRATVDTVTAPFKAARNLLAPASTPAQTLVEPCPDTWAGKKARLEKRQQMIRDGKRSPDPKVRAAAERFEQNNEAVELARLSADTYDRAPPGDPPKPLPVGWSAMSDADVLAKYIDPQLLKDARAVIYQTPEDWPGGQKTVLAFRGTKDLEDGLVDHDQAMAIDTQQYQSAVRLGARVERGLGPDVLVTGHSLGGGKAQAAGASGGLGGMMFNSAGLHPETVDYLMPKASQFTQYRTTGDPLTGVQNSPATQAAIVATVGPLGMLAGSAMKGYDGLSRALGGAGLSPDMADYADKAFKALPRSLRNVAQNGDVMPPAIGAIHQVQTINDAGEVVSRGNLLGQHSITSAINGIEKEKGEDMAVLAAH